MKKRWLIAVIAAYIAVRVYIATLSSYGFYHGWNEGYYSLIAKNYFSGSLWEQIAYQGGAPFSSAPPLFSYAVYASFKVFGISDISARIVSILSEIIAVSGVYILAKELYNEKIACIAAAIFIFIPWNLLWFGRAQTDPLMTALMTLAIALYVRAYKHEKSMLPFGITLGLAVFTKQPALAALPIVLIWSYLEGIKKAAIRNAIVCFVLGMIPLIVWLSHYLVTGNTTFISHFIYGELTNRSAPFSDAFKVSAATLIGISPVVFLVSLYEMIKMENRKANPLVPWLLIFGIFVLVRTPPSHEYYSLPLMPVFAILTASCVIRFAGSRAPIIMAALLVSTVPVSYALLSYTGDMGYTATQDVNRHIDFYRVQYPQDTLLIITPGRYIPQMVWYADLTAPGYSNRQVYGISNDLASVSITDIEKITNTANAYTIFLVIDDRDGLVDRIGVKYRSVYSSQYETKLPNAAGMYTMEPQSAERFGQKLVVFQLK
jgi:4-amino-4-deoxy-L-arabinose transferase-like glycosyltransferase